MAEVRTPRIRETREAEERPMTWRPPELLPDPEPEEGFTFRWIRISSHGQSDAGNLSTKLREGWVPVKVKDHPEVHIAGNSKGEIEFGGLMLCKMPTEMVQQRNAYYNGQAQQQMQSVDNHFMRQSDSRMPLFNDRRTKVTFGSGS